MPIAISAILLGPVAGCITGGFWGLYILIFDPTCATFFQYSWIGTVIVVLGKGMLAGLASGWMNKWLKRYNIYLGMCIAAIIAPLANSLTFRIGEIVFFLPLLGGWSKALTILISLFSISFLIEIGISIVLSPVVCRICILGDSQLNLGVFTEAERERARKKKEEKLESSSLYQFEENNKDRKNNTENNA